MHRKIDVYRVHRAGPLGRVVGLEYLSSTNRYRTCREAADAARAFHNLGSAELVGRFAKGL